MLARFVTMHIITHQTFFGNILGIFVVFCRQFHGKQRIQPLDKAFVSSHKSLQAIHILRYIKRVIPGITFDKPLAMSIQHIEFFLHLSGSILRPDKTQTLVHQMFIKATCEAIGFDKRVPQALPEIVADLDRRGVELCVVSGRDCETTYGFPANNNSILEFCRAYPNKFLGFWGIDPHKGMDAVREVEHVIKDLGMRGIATDPYLAHCPPSDARYYPIYAKCVELGVPVFVTTAPPAQVPRAIMDYIDPRQIDVVARDFPELILIMSHGGYPFVNEAIFACMRNANVYMDLSEYELAPMAEVYVDALNKMIGDKVIFASAHPFIEQADAIEIYKNLNISEEVREKVMYKTAAKILGLDKGVSLNTVKPMAPNGFNNAKFPLPFQPFAPMGR